MYVQPQFEESRPAVLHELIRTHPLATLIVIHNDDIAVNHIPLFVNTDKGDLGVLQGHLPRANSIWESFDGKTKCVAVFQGPATYISPSWYPSKHEHGKAVPTWNYVVTHAHGYPRAVEDKDWLLRHLNKLTDQQESNQRLPWRVCDAPTEFTDKMLSHIIGFEMPIVSIQGKWKVSQNRPAKDQLGVIENLLKQGDDNAMAMADLISQQAT
ncbi:MAG: FMN-binding negative transcriptional regulator [Gammaproteobacteria bacterium]|nr:FMN-binding negative transcriptional regulator [Gammaproteobacteria bacterium]